MIKTVTRENQVKLTVSVPPSLHVLLRSWALCEGRELTSVVLQCVELSSGSSRATALSPAPPFAVTKKPATNALPSEASDHGFRTDRTGHAGSGDGRRHCTDRALSGSGNEPDAMVFTFLRDIDQTLAIGYSEDLSSDQSDFEARGFQLIEARRGTRREERLLLLTLKEIGLQTTYNNNYFESDATVIRHLNQLGWPMGDLRADHPRKRRGKRTDHLVEDN